jgi:NAD(P)-dependent dehydrogenase (short-subunit alcohol dehydrogenase family)
MTHPQPGPPGCARRIVISGASSGIGQAIAQHLSAPEVTIVNLDRLDGAETASSCAALSRATPFLDVPVAELDQLLGVNVRGTFLCCQKAARRMAAAGGGRIVVISSICAFQGWAKESVYCITKGAQSPTTRRCV